MRKAALYGLAVVCVCLLLATDGSSLLAAEGRMGIVQPMTIHQPGHYILLRDLTVAGPTAITIAADNVTLDLNGHTLTATCQNVQSPGVVAIDTTSASKGLVISNGRIRGGCRGIMADGRFSGTRVEIAVHHIDIAHPVDGGILLISVDSATVEDSRVADTSVGIIVDGTGGPWTGGVVNNQVERVLRTGIGVTDLAAGQVRGNSVRDSGLESGGWPALVVSANPGTIGVGGSLITHNTTIGHPNGAGAGITVDTSDNLITDNIATRHGTWGIRSAGSYNRLERNVVTGNAQAGIRLFGSLAVYSHLEANQLRGNGGCGLSIDNAGSHSYRNNIGGANGATGNACIPPGNTDSGGNLGL